MTVAYSKPWLSLADQVNLLKQRGLAIPSDDDANRFLERVNYYRLAGYLLPFEANHADHTLRPGTRLDDVIELYKFDEELRVRVFEAISHLEIAMRTAWAHELSKVGGPHAHLSPEHAKSPRLFYDNLQALARECSRLKKEPYIKHFETRYREYLPPVWAACEAMSFGLLSKSFGNLANAKLRKAIAAHFGVPHDVLESWLQHLNIVRNVCAHHSRLWNRDFTVTPMKPKSRPSDLPSKWNESSRGLFNALLILRYYTDSSDPTGTWTMRLSDLLSAQPAGRLYAMGFRSDSVHDLG